LFTEMLVNKKSNKHMQQIVKIRDASRLELRNKKYQMYSR